MSDSKSYSRKENLRIVRHLQDSRIQFNLKIFITFLSSKGAHDKIGKEKKDTVLYAIKNNICITNPNQQSEILLK